MTKRLFASAIIAGIAICALVRIEAAPGAPPTIPVPAGYGHYCSVTYPNGGWAFSWSDASKDICAELLKRSPGGAIARAGLFSLSGQNNVVYRCNTGVGLIKGDGTAVLGKAYKDSEGKKDCVFTIAPRKLPVFTPPFAPSSAIHLNSGFDFARGFSVKSHLGVDVDKVNYRGNAVTYVEDHDGFDFMMPVMTPLRALAEGVVLAARDRDVTKYKCQTSPQKEVYVLHTVGSGTYREEFVAYYAHLNGIVPGLVAGTKVTRNQLLGFSGNTGCSSGPHLHFGISRFTNTAAERMRNYDVPATEDYAKKTVIDPWGFSWGAKAGFDPWAWRGFDKGVGALSIDLWYPLLAPKRD